ncbi:ABC-type dipeptide transport system, periplasmic component [Clostridium aceticum]|uniref:ABC-type dipeptide transport system, periplasmic component n=1 Tax=Clostridium aceticum TaxID=84022 RepID=A0A0D8IA79_9CLOT|nr:nickel ABC transporter substrate-binding protein [Clostridium aceticum]AKL96335.1 ABC-type dipeptide transport system, periplasmic component [Clostridium aceticum]KJF26927.1 ABC transporter substrate-binding protein [Clostridium aceticum]
MYSFYHQKKRIMAVFLLILILSVSFLSGCSKGTNEEPATNTEGADLEEANKKVTLIFNFKSSSLDPHNGNTAIRAGITETLVRIDENLEVKPWLATGWETKDELTWIFTIREGVTFQDGATMDAAAVQASLERALEVNKGLEGALKIASMEANGQELTIVTTEAHPALPSELINPSAAVVSIEAENTMGREAFNKAPVGTGPFMVKAFTPDVEILLERYDDYWDGKAKLNEVAFKFNEDGNVRALALQSKEADIVYQIPAETVEVVKRDSELKVESIASLRVHFILFNQQKSALQDVKVRKAIDLLLDRESIAKDIMMGNATPANGPFNTRLPFGNKETVQAQNLEEARKLLEEAGFTEENPLTLELLTYQGRPELPLMAQLLQSDAGKIGMTINIKNVESVDTYLRENKDWDMVTYSNLTAPRGDGGFFLNSAFIPGGSLNVAEISSDRLTEVIGRLNAASDIEKRIELTQEAATVINEEVPHAYAVYPNIIVGVNERIIDWKPGAEEYYIITNKMDVR